MASRCRVAGSGVTGDLLAHNIDTAIWLNGPITSSAMTETFIKERKHNLTGKMEPVESTMPARFFAASRTDRWRPSKRRVMRADIRRFITLEINGEHASATGIFTICTACSISIIAMKGDFADGEAFTSPTAIILT